MLSDIKTFSTGRSTLTYFPLVGEFNFFPFGHFRRCDRQSPGYWRHAIRPVLSEILVTRVCGGSNITEIQKILPLMYHHTRSILLWFIAE